jgi:phospholipid/cholesterol/gamma-HCH transport system substrate-binding protein
LGGSLPSQKQLKWSQLKVGITVIVAGIILTVLGVLMSGTGGLFTRTILLKSYVFDAQGLREGAPVRLSGVDVGNVKAIRVVPNRPLSPVEIVMKVNRKYDFNLRKDSKIMLSTAGVLGETYINIDSSGAKGAPVENGDVLISGEVPGYEDVMSAANSSLQNMDVLLKRMDRIIAFVESGQGSVGKLIYDPALYNRVNATVSEFQNLVSEISEGKGSIGKLIADDELYNKANATIDKINKMIDDVNAGNGTVGKLLKDETLYKNLNQTIANAKQLTDDINAGKGAIGKMARDQAFADKLQNTLNRISNLTDKLDEGNGSAAMFLRDPAVYNNTNKLLTDTQELIKAIRQNPKKYLTIHLKLF